MEKYDRSRSSNYGNNNKMQLEVYKGFPPPSGNSNDFKSYSASYTRNQIGFDRDLQLEKANTASRSFSSRSWAFTDPEVQRRKRVASYKMYGVEGKIKGSFRKGFRWIKDRYTNLVYG